MMRVVCLVSEPGIAQQFGRGRDQLAIEPGRGVGIDEPVELLERQDSHRDGPVAKPRGLIGGNALEMVGRDCPTAVGRAFGAAGQAAHRFEAANMGFGEGFRGAWVVLQMRVDRLAAAIGGGDRGDGAIGFADAGRERLTPSR